MEPNTRQAANQLRRAMLACMLTLGAAACGTTGELPLRSLSLASDHASEGTRTALRQILAGASAVPGPVLDFYKARDFRPVWTGDEDARARAAIVTLALNHAERQGLRSADYRVPVPAPGEAPKRGRPAAEYDLTVTRALFRYAHDVSIGRVDPASVYKDVELPKRIFNVGQALSEMLDEDNGIAHFLAELPPPHPEYRRLVAALAQYRAIAKKGEWHHLSAGASRNALAKRLSLEDPKLAAIADPSADDVKAAVRRFQARHGLDTDGNVGPATLRALNVPASARVKEIAANLERWRWLPRRFEPTTIRVNVPDQTVDFVKDGTVALESKVVVGRKSMPTPILKTVAKAVIANPPWDIPDDIAAKSILPHLRRDADYLKSRNMTLIGAPEDAKVDWRKVKGGTLPYQIQELPGPHNALGQVMLDMPNMYYVYLHGTPNQNLFQRDNREISHGCVRVEKIGELAALALGNGEGDGQKAVQDAIDTGATERLPLSQPLPVYLLYWTARAEPDGTVEFPDDRYDRDPPLIARLYGKRDKPAGPHPRPSADSTMAAND